MSQKKWRPIRVQVPSFNPKGGDYDSVVTNIFDILRKFEDHKIDDGQIVLSGATSGDVLVTNDGVVFVPQKFVPYSFTVGTTLTVSGNVVIPGSAPASSTVSRVQIGNPISSGSANGTFLSINAPSGFSGNLIDLSVDSVRSMRVDATRAMIGPFGPLMTDPAQVAIFGASTGLEVNGSTADDYSSNPRIACLSHVNNIKYCYNELFFAAYNPNATATVKGGSALIFEATYQDNGTLNDRFLSIYDWDNLAYRIVFEMGTGRVLLGSLFPPFARLGIQCDPTVDDISLALAAGAIQTQNLQEWQDNGRTKLASVSVSGQFDLPLLNVANGGGMYSTSKVTIRGGDDSNNPCFVVMNGSGVAKLIIGNDGSLNPAPFGIGGGVYSTSQLSLIGVDNAADPLFSGQNNSQDLVFLFHNNGFLIHTLRDNGSGSIAPLVRFGHNTTNTPSAGFGVELQFQLQTSTTPDRDAGNISYEWEVATEGSQISLGRLVAYYITTPMEVMQWGATSTVPKIGFLGAPAAVQQTGGSATAGGTYTATEQAMLQAAYDCLRTFGYLS